MIEEQLSDISLSACLALSDATISMHRLVTTSDCENTPETSSDYSRKGSELFKILEKKLSAARSVITRARIILTMYRLNHETSFVYDETNEAICNSAVRSLYYETMLNCNVISDLEAAYLCQCIAHSLYLIPEYDESEQLMRDFFDRNISSWMTYDWVADLSPAVSKERLKALVCNSDMFMDPSYDDNISIITDYLNRKDNIKLII